MSEETRHCLDPELVFVSYELNGEGPDHTELQHFAMLHSAPMMYSLSTVYRGSRVCIGSAGKPVEAYLVEELFIRSNLWELWEQVDTV